MAYLKDHLQKAGLLMVKCAFLILLCFPGHWLSDGKHDMCCRSIRRTVRVGFSPHPGFMGTG